MSFVTVKSIAASVSNATGARIDTLQLRYPRMVHADFMTHRVFSRNASSSRAIPHASLTVRDADIYVPRFRKNKPGMQPGEFLSSAEQAEAERIWREMAAYILERTAELSEKKGLNIHKQWVNRPLEWFGYIEVLVTSTDWSNFDALRDHPAAQDEIEALAKEMKRVRDATVPRAQGRAMAPALRGRGGRGCGRPHDPRRRARRRGRGSPAHDRFSYGAEAHLAPRRAAAGDLGRPRLPGLLFQA
jgi:hypothetical protein